MQAATVRPIFRPAYMVLVLDSAYGGKWALACDTLCRRSESKEAQYEACSALSELAFRNEIICMSIVHTPCALESLAEILHPRNGNNQEDAALVVRSRPKRWVVSNMLEVLNPCAWK